LRIHQPSGSNGFAAFHVHKIDGYLCCADIDGQTAPAYGCAFNRYNFPVSYSRANAPVFRAYERRHPPQRFEVNASRSDVGPIQRAHEIRFIRQLIFDSRRREFHVCALKCRRGSDVEFKSLNLRPLRSG
jgi:hypothetical protein